MKTNNYLKALRLIAIALAFAGTLVSCRTVDGIGEDVQHVGREIEEAAN